RLPRFELERRLHQFPVPLGAARRFAVREQRRLDRVDPPLLRKVLQTGARKRCRQVLLRRRAPELRSSLRAQLVNYLWLRLGNRVGMRELKLLELDDMKAEARLDHRDLSRFHREHRVFERLDHLAAAKRTEVAALELV